MCCLNIHGLLAKKFVFLMLLLSVALVIGNGDVVVFLLSFFQFDILLYVL